MAENSGSSGPSLLTKFKVAGVAITAILVLVVVLQNTDAVETRILFVTVTVPRAALLFGTLIIGYVLGILTTARMVSRKK